MGTNSIEKSILIKNKKKYIIIFLTLLQLVGGLLFEGLVIIFGNIFEANEGFLQSLHLSSLKNTLNANELFLIVFSCAICATLFISMACLTATRGKCPKKRHISNLFLGLGATYIVGIAIILLVPKFEYYDAKGFVKAMFIVSLLAPFVVGATIWCIVSPHKSSKTNAKTSNTIPFDVRTTVNRNAQTSNAMPDVSRHSERLFNDNNFAQQSQRTIATNLDNKPDCFIYAKSGNEESKEIFSRPRLNWLEPTAPLQSLPSLRLDPTAPPQSLSSLRLDPTAPPQSLSSLRLDPTAPPQSLPSLRLEPTAPLQSLPSLRLDPTAPPQSLSSLRLEPTAPPQSLSSLRLEPTAPPQSLRSMMR